MTNSSTPDDGITTSIRLSRFQRRQLRKLADRVDRVTRADRLLFERRPDRRHRIRLASQAEIEQHAILDGPLEISPGHVSFVVVRNVRPGARLRVFTPNVENGETDLSEAACRAVFESLETPRSREIEAAMLAVSGGE
jgi:hypothetical protein